MSYELITIAGHGELLVDQVSSEYWNDEAKERDKAFNVIDLGFDKIESSSKYSSLLDQLVTLTDKYGIRSDGSKILSVASGTCWLESQWLKERSFESLSCVDISKHRIHKLAPYTMEHYGIDGDVRFLHGSVFDLDDEAGTYDIVLLSQAFHHIEEPIRLLRYLNGLLSEGGVIVIIGEHYYSNFEYHKRAIKHFIKYLINWKGYRNLRNFYPGWQDLFQPDYEKGDIHWSLAEYDFLFKKSGLLSYDHDVHGSHLFQSFVVRGK